MKTFKQLGLSKEVLENLQKLKFVEPSGIQEKAIPHAIKGEDILGSSMTGSGKTLAFSSAIIERIKPSGFVKAVVLTPTRELAQQISEEIEKFSKGNLKITPVYGGVNIQNQLKKMRKTDVLVGTPGRIIDHLNRKNLDLGKVEILVLDEFDRMLDIGFSRDVGKIISFCPKERQTMLFSATNSGSVEGLAREYTNKPLEISVDSQVDPKKLEQYYYDVPSNLKFHLLYQLLNKEKSNLVMIFCSTRRNADFVTANLNNLGIRAKAIHGGLDQNKRIKVLQEFNKSSGLNILVCTDVAARGLDIKGVTHVYNYDLPSITKDYIHRIGRTARAGKDGKAINILSPRDYENFSDIENKEKVNVKKIELPFIERVEILSSSKSRGKNSSRDFESRRPPRGRSGSRSPRSNSRSRDSKGSSRGRLSSRGRSESRGRSNSRGQRRSDSRRSPRSRNSRGKSAIRRRH